MLYREMIPPDFKIYLKKHTHTQMPSLGIIWNYKY